MRVIEQPPGLSSPGHAHEWEHEIFVLSGEGVAQIEKEEFKISEDSVVYFAPHEYHKISTSADSNKPLRWITVIPVGRRV
jgi:quercetin dioxygenase-like cupin family protein